MRTREAFGQQVNTKEFKRWTSPQETLYLDTQDRDLDPQGEQFSFDLSDNAAKWCPLFNVLEQGQRFWEDLNLRSTG